jgi:hypothetical protein
MIHDLLLVALGMVVGVGVGVGIMIKIMVKALAFVGEQIEKAGK